MKRRSPSTPLARWKAFWCIILGALLTYGTSVASGQETGEDLFVVAQLSYQSAQQAPAAQKKRSFEQAVRWLNKYVQKAPSHPEVAKGYFLLATSYAELGKEKEARQAFREVYQRKETGKMGGAAALQLGKGAYQRGAFAEAEPYLERASRELESRENQATALYLRALCLKQEERLPAYRAQLEALLSRPDFSTYHFRAHLGLAELAEKEGSIEEAYEHYRKVGDSGEPANLAKKGEPANLAKNEFSARATAVLKCGFLAHQLGKKEESKRYFKRVLNTSTLEQWHARVGLLLASEAYEEGSWSAVIANTKGREENLTEQQKWQRLSLLGEAHRQLGESQRAQDYYKRLAREARGTSLGFDAAYALLSQEANPREEDLKAFLQDYKGEDFDQARYASVQLLFAEMLFKTQRYQEALAVYRALPLSRLEAANHPTVAYRLVLANDRLGDTEKALEAAQDFLRRYPLHAQAPEMTYTLATLLAQKEEHQAALTLLEKLLQRTSPPEVEGPSLVLLARLSIQTERFEQAAATFERLLAHKGNKTKAPAPTPPERAKWQFWQAYALFKLERFAEARPLFEKAREFPESEHVEEATTSLAITAYRLGDPASLREEVKRADALGLNALPAPLLLYLAHHLAGQEEWEEAWNYFTKGFASTSLEEQAEPLLMSYAEVAQQREEYAALLQATMLLKDRALAPYQRALTLYRHALALYHEKGAAQAHAQGDAQAAIRMNPTGPLKYELLLLEGQMRLALGEDREATRLLLQVAELAGKENRAEKIVALRALIELSQGKENEAGRQKVARYTSLLRTLTEGTTQ